MGAIYQAAANTRGFLVKRIVLRDMTRYPIAVSNTYISVISILISFYFLTLDHFPSHQHIS